MTRKARNIESPTSTWLDGADCVPRACRRKCSTITMRRNGLTDITTAGRSVSSVNKMTIWVGVLKVSPPLGLPAPKTGMAVSFAGAARAAAAKNRNKRRERNLIIGCFGGDHAKLTLEGPVRREVCTTTERLRSTPSV